MERIDYYHDGDSCEGYVVSSERKEYKDRVVYTAWILLVNVKIDRRVSRKPLLEKVTYKTQDDLPSHMIPQILVETAMTEVAIRSW